MKRLLPGLITALIGGLALREAYAKGFNKGVDECTKKVKMYADITEHVKKKEKEES